MLIKSKPSYRRLIGGSFTCADHPLLHHWSLSADFERPYWLRLVGLDELTDKTFRVIAPKPSRFRLKA